MKFVILYILIVILGFQKLEADTVLIKNPSSPDGKMELMVIREKNGHDSFCLIDKASGDKLATVFQEGEEGAPQVTRAEVSWHPEGECVFVQLDFSKTSTVLVFQRSAARGFASIACKVPDTMMIADVLEDEFGIPKGFGFRIDSTHCKMGPWKGSEIRFVKFVNLITDKSEIQSYGCAVTMRKEGKSLNVTRIAKVGKINPKLEKILLQEIEFKGDYASGFF